MKKGHCLKRNPLFLLVGLFISLIAFSQTQQPRSKMLLDFESSAEATAAQAGRGAQIQLTRTAKGNSLRLVATQARIEPSLTLRAPGGSWDLSSFLAIVMDIKNSGPGEVLVECRLNDSKWVDGAASLPPGATKILHVLLKRKSPPDHLKNYLFGMNGMPGGYVGIWEVADPARISSLQLFLRGTGNKRVIDIDNVRAIGAFDPPTEDSLRSSFFPIVDQFGQYRHMDWPGKIHSAEDFNIQLKAEEADLAGNQGPDGWDQYGGWASGPQLKSTGHFRVEKFKGKWWFVDPEGRLFWSHGIDCVAMSNATPISARDRFFAELPEKPAQLLRFYGMGRQAAQGYYREHAPFRTYDFSRANLVRKYGEKWQQVSAEIIHRRLRSWGMNTIANWSAETTYLLRKTPYVGTISTDGPPIQGSEGHWRQFPDPFDPGFRQALQKRLAAEQGKSAGDSWCIGYFVDNELSWGDETALALAVLTSPPNQRAKEVLADDLKMKYETIARLNQAWGTSYPSWQALLSTRQAPDKTKARKDLVTFNARLAEEYFRVCRETIKEAAPDALYLGCRFDFHFYPGEEPSRDWLIQVAARYCDVISFNRYRFSASDLVPPAGVDKPLIIGEFHFGALDRGMLHTGLRSVMDQQQRGEMYRSYVSGALKNPFMVGTHWFQYADQPVTGRGDGENYQIGFVDVGDNPYPETINASRQVGYRLYETRLANR